MNTLVRLIHLSVVCALLCGSVFAEETGFVTHWDKAESLEGFKNPSGSPGNPGEGGHPGGFFRATRAGGVNVTVRPTPYLRDSWAVAFGTDAGTISFDVKVFSDHAVPAISFWLSDGSSAFRYIHLSKWTLRHDQTKADGWVRYTIPWQANWDTAKPKEKKWRPNRDGASWVKVIHNPRYSHLDILGAGKHTPSFCMRYSPGRPEGYFYVNSSYYLRAKMPPGKWYHLVGTFADGGVTFYVNGRRVGARPAGGRLINRYGDGKFWLGGRPGQESFLGKLKDARLYERALTHGEVVQHFKAGPATSGEVK